MAHTVGIELIWSRCRDGADWKDFGPPEIHNNLDRRAVMLGTDDRRGVWIKNRSYQPEFYTLRLSDLKKPVFEKFINSQSAADFTKFVTEFGIPGGYEGIDATETEMKSLTSVRDAMRNVLEISRDGTKYDCSRAFNTLVLELKGTALKPLLSIWQSKTHPTLCFQPTNLYGFMAMEIAMATSSAAALRTCHHCTTAFLAGTLTSKRKNAYYCSNKCRVAAQRAKSASN